MTMESVNPYTKKSIRKYTETSPEEVNVKLNQAREAYAKTRRISLGDRRSLLAKTAGHLKDRREALAKIAVDEMGKTITAARAEVAKCELGTNYFVEQIEKINQPIKVEGGKSKQFIQPLPIGCVLAVMPWNFPYWQVFRAALAALSTGNTMVLKHASNVSGVALEIEKLFVDAGWPSGTFQTLLISSNRVKDLISDSRIAAVTLTGSEAAGRSVAEHAGRNLKKTVLELGGSDPFIVTSQAEVVEAAKTAAKARTLNNGQSCIAAKRFILEKSISKQFLETFISTLSAMKVGDPMREETEIGPLVTEKAYRDLKDQVERAVIEGGKLLLEPIFNDAQNLFGPAVIQVPADKINSGVFAEEFFGPVALVYEVANLDEAISVANNSSFGLGSAIWTKSQAEIDRAIREIEAGLTFVNSFTASEPQLPFGGVKNSGYGRELGYLGPHEFVNMKSVSIAQSEPSTQKVGD